MKAVELNRSLERGPADHGIQDAGSVCDLCRTCDGGGAALADRRGRGAALLQPPDVSVANKPFGMPACEDDGVNAWVVVDAVHQLL